MTTLQHPGKPVVARWRIPAYWWIVLSSLAIATFAVTPYLVSSLPVLAKGNVGLSRNYLDRGLLIHSALYVHVACAGLALVLSPMQFATRIRTRAPRVHRVIGRVVLVAIALGGSAGIVISTVSEAGLVGTIGFGLLGVFWIGSALSAFRAIRRGKVDEHRRWMIRTFALTYAGVTLRIWQPLLTGLLTALGLDATAAWNRAYTVMPFLCWVPNLLLTQWLLIRKNGAPQEANQLANPRASR
jgi:uncharacterized membrane protein